MKLKNLFKKDSQSATTSTIQKLDKNQLDKIVGGSTEVITATETSDSRTTKVYEKATDKN